MIDVIELMNRLGSVRPLFHSEADFQHAFAWELQRQFPQADVRLEYRPLPSEAMYVDVWVHGATACAFELKYWTRKILATIGGEVFSLKDQGAQDISRYDAIKDLRRLEQIVRTLPNAEAWAVWLTNDSTYWKQPVHVATADASFRIHDGRVLTGLMAWSDRAGPGTTKGREQAIHLSGRHVIAWRDYASVNGDARGLLRYAACRVQS